MRNIMIILGVFVVGALMFVQCPVVNIVANNTIDFKSKCAFEAHCLEQFRDEILHDKDTTSNIELEKVELVSVFCTEDGTIGIFLVQTSGTVDYECIRIQAHQYMAAMFERNE